MGPLIRVSVNNPWVLAEWNKPLLGLWSGRSDGVQQPHSVTVTDVTPRLLLLALCPVNTVGLLMQRDIACSLTYNQTLTSSWNFSFLPLPALWPQYGSVDYVGWTCSSLALLTSPSLIWAIPMSSVCLFIRHSQVIHSCNSLCSHAADIRVELVLPFLLSLLPSIPSHESGHQPRAFIPELEDLLGRI